MGKTSVSSSGGLKRKRSEDHDNGPTEKYPQMENCVSLDCLCDEVLLEIFKRLDTQDLLALRFTCSRFAYIVQDRCLWFNINLNKPTPISEIEYALKCATVDTKLVKITGPPNAHPYSPSHDKICLMKYLIPKCTQLTELEVENIHIDFNKISVHTYPVSLKRLIFRNITVSWSEDTPTIFNKIKSLRNLEDLVVERCIWFHPYDLMLFSKIPSLKKLSLRGCRNLFDFVPYGSMASRFGFKSLEYLDVRDTPISDADLQCFNAISTLKNLLLECPTDARDINEKGNIEGNGPSTSTASSSSSSQPSSSSANVTTEKPIDGGQYDGPKPSTSRQSRIQIACASRIGPPAPERRAPSNVQQPVVGNGQQPAFLNPPPEQPAIYIAQPAAAAEIMRSPDHIAWESAVRPPGIPRNASNSMVVLVNMQNQTRSLFLNGRLCELHVPDSRRGGRAANFQVLLQHPSFWEMVNRQLGMFRTANPMVIRKCPISNRGIASFGRPPIPVDNNFIWIGLGLRMTDNNLERLVVRHYSRVTDDSLDHLVQCSPNLVYLDVTGCGVTPAGIKRFTRRKPTCEVVCEHLGTLLHKA